MGAHNLSKIQNYCGKFDETHFRKIKKNWHNIYVCAEDGFKNIFNSMWMLYCVLKTIFCKLDTLSMFSTDISVYKIWRFGVVYLYS